MKKLGFTLAEVLITLAIIGVVAAMTVPALMSSTRGKEYEVGANKALSTIANALTMRAALEGVAPVNFTTGSIGEYLTIPPGTFQGSPRPGEQAVLPTAMNSCEGNVEVAGNPAAPECNIRLKDGMIVTFPAGAANVANTSNGAACGNLTIGTGGCVLVVDTNGVKGPTRSIDTKGANRNAAGTAICNDPGIVGNNTAGVVTANACPDIIRLRIRDTIVEPADNRSKNILNSGNAMISQ